MPKPTIFLSYSHDSASHRAKVQSLAEQLKADGFGLYFDQDLGDAGPAQGWPRWMLHGLESSDGVLCVCTELYKQRFLGLSNTAPNTVQGGKGVDWEGALITQTLFELRTRTMRFFPVCLSAADEPHIPLPLAMFSRYRLDTAQGYQALVSGLQHDLQPPSPPHTQAPKTAAYTASPPAYALARKTWQEKLDFLAVEQAVAVDPAMKFRIQHLIDEAQARLRDLDKGSKP